MYKGEHLGVKEGVMKKKQQQISDSNASVLIQFLICFCLQGATSS